MTVYTGASTSVMYGYESTYGTAASSLTNIFGIDQKVSSLTLTNNRIDLNKLGQVEPTKFAYGQQAGTCSIGFVFDDGDSHKIFQSVYGSPSGAGSSGSPYLYPTTLAQGATSPTVNPLTTQISVQTGADKIVRTLKGCIVNSISLSTSIGETLNGSVDMTFGKEDTAAVTTASSTITQQTDGSVDQGTKPYTFAHGQLKVSNGTSPQAVAEIQDVDITFAQNSELLYGLNSNSAVDAFRRVFEITGKFRTAFKDSALIQYVIDQVRTGQELLDNTSGVGIELTFTNGSKSIKLELDDLSVADHSTTGIEPVEPIFEEINWKIKQARVTVINS